ncbi:MAG: MraY family glycosyltransferase [Bacteroidaceae bacterium]|jgi:UDP-N-acetylmuramyl pentapeptide phosphotransferase/UDP-N-acetylglucosamine-1-phosphate transferase
MNSVIVINALTVACVFGLAFLMENILLPKILLISRKKHLYDIPDARKVHKVATPRLAGVSFVPVVIFSFLTIFTLRIWLIESGNLQLMFPSLNNAEVYAMLNQASLLSFQQELYMLMCGLILLLLVGVKDDLVGVTFMGKFRVQILAAALFCFGGVFFESVYGILGVHELPIYISIPFSIFVIVLVTNSINLIDGIDGLASGLSIVAFVTMGVSFFMRNMVFHSMLSFACVGLLIPFFYYNVFMRQVRKLFLGDTGSLAIGFLLGYLAIKHSQLNPGETYDVMPILLPFSVLFLPAFDVARVMYTRKMMGHPLFMPDRNHIHHKLIDAGFSHHATMIFIILLSLAVLLLNMLLSLFLNINLIIILDFLLGIGFNKWLAVYSARRSKRLQKS